MLATLGTATMCGVAGHPVTVEAHVSDGLPGYSIVGLPDTTCRESRDRVRAAVLSTGLIWPNRRVTVNLAPSGLRKLGAGLDLAIAVGVLAASGQINDDGIAALANLAMLGELGLDGSVRPVAGVLPMSRVDDGRRGRGPSGQRHRGGSRGASCRPSRRAPLRARCGAQRRRAVAEPSRGATR